MSVIPTVYASEVESHETQATSQEAGLLGSLGIKGSLFVSQLITFLLVLAIVWFLILKPVTKKMTERQRIIDDSLDQAQKIQEKMTKSEREYQERIDQAKVESNKILEKATSEATDIGNTIKEKAKRDIELLIDQAKRNLQIEKEDMLAAVKKESANLIVSALEKILGEAMTAEADKKNIAAMVSKMTYEKK